MHKIAIVLLSLMLITAPVLAQESPAPATENEGNGLTVSIPEGSPWWAGIALAIIGSGGWALRSYSGRLDRKQQAALDKQRNEFQLQLERVKLEAAEQTADASQIGALASSISEMAQSVNSAITTLAQERLQASEERGKMRETMEEQAKGIRERNQLLRETKEKLGDVDAKVTPINATLEQIVQELQALKEQVRDIATRQQMERVILELSRIKGIPAQPSIEAPAPPAKTPLAEHGTVLPDTKTG